MSKEKYRKYYGQTILYRSICSHIYTDYPRFLYKIILKLMQHRVMLNKKVFNQLMYAVIFPDKIILRLYVYLEII